MLPFPTMLPDAPAPLADDATADERLQAALDAMDEAEDDDEFLEELDDEPPDHEFDPADPFSDFEEEGVDPRDPMRRVRVPCPREIRARCEAIQATWTPLQRWMRTVCRETRRAMRGTSVVAPTIADRRTFQDPAA